MIKFILATIIFSSLTLMSCSDNNRSSNLELEMLDSIKYPSTVLQKWDYTKGQIIKYDNNEPTVYYLSSDRSLISYNIYKGEEKIHYTIDSALFEKGSFISVHDGVIYMYTRDWHIYEISSEFKNKLIYKPDNDSFMIATFYTDPFHVDNNNIYISYLIRNTMNNLGQHSIVSLSKKNGEIKQFLLPLPEKYRDDYIYFRSNTMNINKDFAYLGLQYTDSLYLYDIKDSITISKSDIEIFSDLKFNHHIIKDPTDFIKLNDYINKEWLNIPIFQYHTDKKQTYVVKRLPSEDGVNYKYALGKVEDTTYFGSVILPEDFSRNLHFILNDTLFYQSKGTDICKKYLIKRH